MTLSTCQKCSQEKDATAFHRKGDGLQRWCKSCHNQYQRETRKRRETPAKRQAANLKARYKLTTSDIAAMTVSQDGRCAVCATVPKRFVVDHNHSTGAVRGLLCHRCNILIGALDDEAFRVKALSYLGLTT